MRKAPAECSSNLEYISEAGLFEHVKDGKVTLFMDDLTVTLGIPRQLDVFES